ncbi:uncharacterized protein MKS88_000056 [Plasmodium brasilianum]|uniref:Plasmodium RESA N-terminal domain-containing protein n=1 Tax=Plasmodium malariae TaxID=5858 RepID=A0A1D3JHI2_PLAMA|nr:Plasmodium exported protein, unknown function [Plasmodium malariae]KAI4841518.1 hypothetical protein MKS88_000056 [Plasmodium brasilianum]SBT85694.1 Plasmodium exported protein, unknown function [Plasmodium malariae]
MIFCYKNFSLLRKEFIQSNKKISKNNFTSSLERGKGKKIIKKSIRNKFIHLKLSEVLFVLLFFILQNKHIYESCVCTKLEGNKRGSRKLSNCIRKINRLCTRIKEDVKHKGIFKYLESKNIKGDDNEKDKICTPMDSKKINENGSKIFKTNKSTSNLKRIPFGYRGSDEAEKLTEEEIGEKINNLGDLVSVKEMYTIWNYVHNNEKKVYIKMQQAIRTYCEYLASIYGVPNKMKNEEYMKACKKMTYKFLEKEKKLRKNFYDLLKNGAVDRAKFISFIFETKKIWCINRNKMKNFWNIMLTKKSKRFWNDITQFRKVRAGM